MPRLRPQPAGGALRLEDGMGKKKQRRKALRRHIAELLERDGSLASRILATTSPEYQEIFAAALNAKPLTKAEERVLRAAGGSRSGGYPVPANMDPTLLPRVREGADGGTEVSLDGGSSWQSVKRE